MSSSIIIKKGGLSLSGRGPRPRIPGVFPAVQFGEQVVSTGVPSLDAYIGGGVPVGSIMIIQDAWPCRYSDTILKSFIAEGASYNHHLFVASERVSSTTFANELPSRRKESLQEETTKVPSSVTSAQDKTEEEKLRIAWRYKDSSPLPVTLSSRGGVIKGQKSAKFEFTKKTTAAELGGHNLSLSRVFDVDDFSSPSALALLREISAALQPFSLNPKKVGLEGAVPNNLVRIAISHCETQVLDPLFMMGLRALVRSSNSCAVITLSNLASEQKLISRAEHSADSLIHLQVILDEKKKLELGGVDGLCNVVKINPINSLKPVQRPTDLGFTFRKKRLTFQELHLPPEGETTTQREVAHSRPVSGGSCGSTIKGKSIDF